MLDLQALEQLLAFAERGTLSRVAEDFHVSTPSVTRTMQHLEQELGVTLFTRGKNRIELNETGKVAVTHARRLLQETEQMVQQVREFAARQRTIVVKSCAPAPLWELLRQLNVRYPDITISSDIAQNDVVFAAWEKAACDVAILPFPQDGAKAFFQEHLFVCVPQSHELAGHTSLTFADINGFNFLLRSELGFWDVLCREKMPSSKFLVQTDVAVFDELVKASSLPCFTTEYGGNWHDAYPDRVHIPLEDAEANVTFYLLQRENYLLKSFMSSSAQKRK